MRVGGAKKNRRSNPIAIHAVAPTLARAFRKLTSTSAVVAAH
jgi:hypothetical protein